MPIITTSTDRFGRCARIATMLSLAFVVSACADESRVTAPEIAPVMPPMLALAELRGTVNVAAGTLTFEEPIGARSAMGGAGNVSLAIYGNQGVTVRLSNTPVTVAVSPTDPAKKTFTAQVGVRNLLTHAIGDEQGGALPADTSGIFVFFNTGPTVVSTSSPCPACTVTLQNNHGTLAFNAPGQKYFHWQERLGAAGTATDTTRNRTTWVFEADSAVRDFSFTVLVSAHWPPPDETVWRVEYSGDSLPHTEAEPRWRRVFSGAAGPSDSAGAGFLRIDMGSPVPLNTTDLHYQRRDSLVSTTSAFAEARIKLVSGTGDAHTGFGFDDDTKQIELGISTTEVGFIDEGHGFIQHVPMTTNVYRTYQIRKFAADSVQLWVDGTRQLTVIYLDFKANAVAATLPSYFRFGSHGKGGVSNVSDWDYVIYQIGRSSP